MTGDRHHETVSDVVSYWRAWAAERGFRRRVSGIIVRELNVTELESPVYISVGCYVADCPNRECNGAAAVWIENPQACCLDCGTVFKPVWPTKTQIGGEMADAVEVLSLRPNPMWRNFHPHKLGETVADLKAQNLAMGDAIPGGRAAKGPHPLDATLLRS